MDATAASRFYTSCVECVLNTNLCSECEINRTLTEIINYIARQQSNCNHFLCITIVYNQIHGRQHNQKFNVFFSLQMGCFENT